MRATLSTLVAAALTATSGLLLASTVSASPPQATDDTRIQTVRIVGDATPQKQQIADTGVDIQTRIGTGTVVAGTPQELQALRELGLRLEPTTSSAESANQRVATVQRERAAAGRPGFAAGDFPAGDEAYHTYPETVSFMDSTVASYPTLASKKSIGRSVEGRDLWMLRLGKAPAGSPEIVITCNQHAREHLTTEQCLYIAEELTTKYASDSRIQKIMDTRVIWVMPVMNPDGSTYDIASGSYKSWRKNRTKNSDGSIGVDLNRNWSYQRGCCGGASNNPSSDSYRGPSAFSEPETKAVSDFIASRRVGGVQQVKAYLDIHTFSEIVMYPFGWTTSATTDRMTQDQHDMLDAVAKKLASSNGYDPQQSSEMYITDGDSLDWAWGDQQITTIGFEMYPGSSSGGGFYPPASVIGRETKRNREALLSYFELAACPYTLTGKAEQYCSEDSTDPADPTDPVPTDGVLSNGVGVSVSGAAKSETFYTVDVPAGATNLVISTSGGSGDVDLYTRAGSAPTDTAYDCRPYKSGNDETCTVAAPVPGKYHVRLKAFSAYSGVTLTATVR